MKDCISLDRARIQIGRISSFGLLEMSRQRLRPGMIESTTMPCSFCHGTGTTRSDESLALQILRDLEKEGSKSKNLDTVLVKSPVQTTNFLINYKREHLLVIENRYQIKIELHAEVNLISPHYSIEKPVEDKPSKKNTANNKTRARKRDNDHNRGNLGNIQDQNISTNLINGSNGEDVDDQKKRKRKRKRKYQKDLDSPSSAKPRNNKADPLAFGNQIDAEPSVANENLTGFTVKATPDQKKGIGTETSTKKEKATKPRTKASAKKTIEGLKNHDDRLIENDDSSKDKKMGKKGWWDR